MMGPIKCKKAQTLNEQLEKEILSLVPVRAGFIILCQSHSGIQELDLQNEKLQPNIEKAAKFFEDLANYNEEFLHRRFYLKLR